MHRPATVEQLAQLNLSEAKIRGLSWLNNGKDLDLVLTLPSFPDQEVEIGFRSISNLDMRMSFGQARNIPPSVSDVQYQQDEDGHRVRLESEGTPIGMLAFRYTKENLEWRPASGG